MSKLYIPIGVLLGIFLICGEVLAKPDFDVQVSASNIKLDEPLTLSVQAQWRQEEANYVFAFPNVDCENLSLERQGESQESFVLGLETWVRKSFVLYFKPNALGNAVIRGFKLGYMDPLQQKGGSFDVAAQEIMVHSSGVTWPPKFPGLALGGISLMAFLGIAAGIYYSNKLRKRQDLRPAERDELIQLRSLAEEIQKRPQKEIMHHYSQLLKVFLTSYYGMKGKPTVDGEILAEIQSLEISRREKEAVRNILNRLSEAKYAGSALSQNELRDLHREIAYFVETRSSVQSDLGT